MDFLIIWLSSTHHELKDRIHLNRLTFTIATKHFRI